MNRQFGNTILQFMIGFTVFFAVILVVNFYDLLIIDLFSLETKTFLQEVKNYPYNTFRELYPRYYFFVFLAIQLSKYFIYVAVVLLSLSLFFLYKKRINKEKLFKVYLLTASLFLIEISISFLNVNRLLNLEYRGKLITQDLEIRPKYRADELGINTMLPESNYLRDGYIVNKQGFRSKYNFTTTYIDSLKQLGKVIMFVGDSHTEGMWAEPIDSSFVDLIDQREDIFCLNFGISGTDPLQYKLIVEKYLENLNPDLLVIPFCINNDFIDLDRKPKPFKPLWVHTNFSSLSNILPKTHPEYQFDTYFNNWEEVKSFYLHYYTLYGENINFFEKYIVDASNIFKLIYHLPISYKKRVNYSNAIKIDDKIKEKNISIKHIRAIKRMTDDLSIPFLLVGVPSLNDLNKNIDKINQNYKAIFEDVNILIPTHFEKYDYASNDNDHFNNVGHKKFADYINQRVDSIFQMR